MNHQQSRQPIWQPWTHDELKRGCVLAVANAVDSSTCQAYRSALNSWIAFANMHHFPFEPNINTLSFFIVYMSHQISPRSVKSYLSGLVQQLEPDLPSICEVWSSRIITKVMHGCLKMRGTEVKRKRALSLQDVAFIIDRFKYSQNHNNFLFLALLVTGFHGLLRFGELTFPDNPAICNWRKVSKHSSLIMCTLEYEFLLPAHKADKFFEGNHMLICAFPSLSFSPIPIFLSYLSSRDHYF